MDPSLDLVEHFRLEAEFYPDVTLHNSHTFDRSKGRLRRVKVVKRWSRQKSLGHGTFGTVWLETEDDGSKRAVKEISKSMCSRNQIDYKKELATMAKLSRFNEFFVDFFGWFENSETIYLGMEYFEHGDLQLYIAQKIIESHIKIIVVQLLEGLKIMHQHGFTHRDLKPQNIFVVTKDPVWWVKIGDFGITKRILNEDTFLKTEIGTRDYLAPEVIGYVGESTSEYTNAVDIWSLGCICHLLLTHQLPFANLRSLGPYCWGKSTLPIETGNTGQASIETVNFVKGLMTPEPEERWDIDSALQSPWLADVEEEINSEEPAGISSVILRKPSRRGDDTVVPISKPNTQLTPVHHEETRRPQNRKNLNEVATIEESRSNILPGNSRSSSGDSDMYYSHGNAEARIPEDPQEKTFGRGDVGIYPNNPWIPIGDMEPIFRRQKDFKVGDRKMQEESNQAMRDAEAEREAVAARQAELEKRQQAELEKRKRDAATAKQAELETRITEALARHVGLKKKEREAVAVKRAEWWKGEKKEKEDRQITFEEFQESMKKEREAVAVAVKRTELEKREREEKEGRQKAFEKSQKMTSNEEAYRQFAEEQILRWEQEQLESDRLRREKEQLESDKAKREEVYKASRETKVKREAERKREARQKERMEMEATIAQKEKKDPLWRLHMSGDEFQKMMRDEEQNSQNTRMLHAGGAAANIAYTVAGGSAKDRDEEESLESKQRRLERIKRDPKWRIKISEAEFEEVLEIEQAIQQVLKNRPFAPLPAKRVKPDKQNLKKPPHPSGVPAPILEYQAPSRPWRLHPIPSAHPEPAPTEKGLRAGFKRFIRGLK